MGVVRVREDAYLSTASIRHKRTPIVHNQEPLCIGNYTPPPSPRPLAPPLRPPPPRAPDQAAILRFVNSPRGIYSDDPCDVITNFCLLLSQAV